MDTFLICAFITIQTVIQAAIMFGTRSEIKGMRNQMQKENDAILERLDSMISKNKSQTNVFISQSDSAWEKDTSLRNNTLFRRK